MLSYLKTAPPMPSKILQKPGFRHGGSQSNMPPAIFISFFNLLDKEIKMLIFLQVENESGRNAGARHMERLTGPLRRNRGCAGSWHFR